MLKTSRFALPKTAIAVCSIVACSAAWADQTALTFTGGSTYGYVTEPIPNTIGWQFTLSSSLTLTNLGYYDVGGDGLVSRHSVAIWDLSGNQLASAIVGSPDLLAQGFRWTSVSPLTLGAGTYRIGAEVGNDDYYYSGTEVISTADQVTYDGGVYSTGGFAYPSSIGYTNNGRFGPNFMFTAASNVPEPFSLALVGLGVAGLALARRRKQK